MPARPFCLLGLQETYGLEFAEFVPLDAGGPLTVQALTGGQVDVGLLFTSDPAIATNGFVLLEDDKQLQLADNIVPVVRQEVLDANPGVTDLLNTVMERLTQEELTNLNKAVTVDARAAAEVATEWITAQNFDASSAGLEGDITVSSITLRAGDPGRDLRPDAREQRRDRGTQVPARQPRDRLPSLEAGEIDVLVGYAATPSSSSNGGAGRATSDPEATTVALRAALEPKVLAALNYAAATDQNGFVVSKATADQYGLTKISDWRNRLPPE